MWNLVHNIETLPSQIKWNMHLLDAIATFPQVFGLYREPYSDDDDELWGDLDRHLNYLDIIIFPTCDKLCS